MATLLSAMLVVFLVGAVAGQSADGGDAGTGTTCANSITPVTAVEDQTLGGVELVVELLKSGGRSILENTEEVDIPAESHGVLICSVGNIPHLTTDLWDYQVKWVLPCAVNMRFNGDHQQRLDDDYLTAINTNIPGPTGLTTYLLYNHFSSNLSGWYECILRGTDGNVLKTRKVCLKDIHTDCRI